MPIEKRGHKTFARTFQSFLTNLLYFYNRIRFVEDRQVERNNLFPRRGLARESQVSCDCAAQQASAKRNSAPSGSGRSVWCEEPRQFLDRIRRSHECLSYEEGAHSVVAHARHVVDQETQAQVLKLGIASGGRFVGCLGGFGHAGSMAAAAAI